MRSAAVAALLGLAASPGEANQHSTFRVHAEAKNDFERLKKDWPKRK